MRAGLVISWLAACGSSTAPAPAAPPAPSIVAPPESAADVQVATVNGRPVWGSCVAHQGKPAREGLDECIGFELMAQAAERRGLGSEAGVVAATRTAQVNRLVATEFEAKVTTFADFHGAFDTVLEKNAFRMHQPHIRTSAYVRATVAANAAPELEARAHAAAAQVAAALRDQTGLFPVTLDEAADRITHDTGVVFDREQVGLMLRGAMDRPYADALYAIPEEARIAGPVRTRWGWDVILWTGGIPAKEITRDDLAAGLFPELRTQYFKIWVENLRKQLGIAVAIDASQLDTGTGS